MEKLHINSSNWSTGAIVERIWGYWTLVADGISLNRVTLCDAAFGVGEIPVVGSTAAFGRIRSGPDTGCQVYQVYQEYQDLEI